MIQYTSAGSRRLLTGALSAAALSIMATPTASACGGFFCQQVPVDQSGEQILFSVEGTTVTAHIQIAYQGEAEKFSWVLPLPAVPELGVGTDEVFTQLRQVTDPTFRVDWQPVDGCSGGQDCMYAPSAGGGVDDAESGTGNNGVDILAQGDVGAFEYKVVQSDTGDALFTWLNDNGYDQPDASKPLVNYYVNQKYVFLGLRLQKDKSVGEMQPVVLKYTSADLACVPLKLTAIAAMADMPVTTWILANARAVPLNFFHVVLNAKAYPWLTCGGGYYYFGGNTDCSKAYQDLVTEASNAANGHAFVTEYAGTSTLMADRLYTEGRFNVSKLASTTDPVLFLQELMNQGFPRGGQIQAMIKKWIPRPEGLPTECADDSAFYSFNMETCIQYMPKDYVFDAAGFAADVDENVVAPLKAAQALFQSQPYLTRLFTTISPDEMDKDPMFSFNPDLPDVAREHVVKATPVCEGGSTSATKVTLEYPDGSTETVGAAFNGCQPPVLTGDASGAVAYAEIQVLSESGAPEAVAVDDVAKREAQLEVRAPTAGQASLPQNPAVVGTIDARAGTFGTRPTDAVASSSSSSGCTSTGTGSTAAFGVFALGLALLGLRRRV